MIGLLLLLATTVGVVMAQDRKAKFNTVQCEAFRNVVSASFLPMSSPCFDRAGGQIGINNRAVSDRNVNKMFECASFVVNTACLKNMQDETRVAQCRFRSACLEPDVAPPNVTMLSASEQAELFAIKCPSRPYQESVVGERGVSRRVSDVVAVHRFVRIFTSWDWRCVSQNIVFATK